MPASLLKAPRWMPYRITPINVPPTTALPLKASVIINQITPGTSLKFKTKIISAAIIYKPPIKGTSHAEACAILLSPPITTRPVTSVIKTPIQRLNINMS